MNKLNNNLKPNFNVLLFHEDALKDKKNIDIVDNFNSVKIIASDKISKTSIYDAVLKIPASLKEINTIVENCAAKKLFNKNSSIKIKNFLLDKNEKKLIKEKNFIILTEKEIQLLEIFLTNKNPISKNKILSLVWHYSSDADTHTVETHIYRLRKKIKDEFCDEQFIVNNKEGYYI